MLSMSAHAQRSRTVKRGTVLILGVGAARVRKDAGAAHSGAAQSSAAQNSAGPPEAVGTAAAGDPAASLLVSKLRHFRKNDLVGVVLAGTRDSDNPLATGKWYSHLSVAHPLAPVTVDVLATVDKTLTEEAHCAADPVQAVVLATHLLQTRCYDKAKNAKPWAKDIIACVSLEKSDTIPESVNAIDIIKQNLKSMDIGVKIILIGPSRDHITDNRQKDQLALLDALFGADNVVDVATEIARQSNSAPVETKSSNTLFREHLVFGKWQDALPEDRLGQYADLVRDKPLQFMSPQTQWQSQSQSQSQTQSQSPSHFGYDNNSGHLISKLSFAVLVEGYKFTSQEPLPRRFKYCLDGDKASKSHVSREYQLTIENSREAQMVNMPNYISGQVEYTVPKEDLIHTFLFARSTIPLQPNDERLYRIRGPYGILVHAVFSMDELPNKMFLDDAILLAPQRSGQDIIKNYLSYSGLAQALADSNSWLLVRFQPRKLITETVTDLDPLDATSSETVQVERRTEPYMAAVFPSSAPLGFNMRSATTEDSRNAKAPKPLALFMAHLPFADDMRNYQFPKLDDVMLAGRGADSPFSKSATETARITDEFIDALMLDESYMAAGSIRNPQIERVWDCISHRVRFPSVPLPPPRQELVNLVNPPQPIANVLTCKDEDDGLAKVVGDSASETTTAKGTFGRPIVERFADCFLLKTIERKRRGAGVEWSTSDLANFANEATDLVDSGLPNALQHDDLVADESAGGFGLRAVFASQSLNGAPKRATEVSEETPVRDFSDMMEALEDGVDLTDKALIQISDVIIRLARDPIKVVVVLNCLRAMKDACRKMDEFDRYNILMVRLKRIYLDNKSITGELWSKIKNSGLGLFTEGEIATAGLGSALAYSRAGACISDAEAGAFLDDDDFDASNVQARLQAALEFLESATLQPTLDSPPPVAAAGAASTPAPAAPPSSLPAQQGTTREEEFDEMEEDLDF